MIYYEKTKEELFNMDVQVGDIIITRKPHPCGENRFAIQRVGIEFRMQCCKCGHEVLVARSKMEKNIKKILRNGEEIHPNAVR